jgi:hypothetical protein
MKVSVNDRPIETSEADGTTLEALLDSMRDRGEIRDDEVVVGLTVEGRPWRADDLEALGQADLGRHADVAIATDDMQGYARRILNDSRSMLAVLEEGASRLAAELREDDAARANADLFNLLNALQSFLACLYHVRNMCGIEGGPLGTQQQLVARMTGALDLMELSQERRDWTSLAEQLEAELLPALEGLRGMVDEMAAAVRGDTGG